MTESSTLPHVRSADPETTPAGRVRVLSNDGNGAWLVRTESETAYLLNLDNRTVIRNPHRVPSRDEGLSDVLSMKLRRDSEPLPLLEVTRAEVGYPLSIVIQVRQDTIPTLRRSTNVASIDPYVATVD